MSTFKITKTTINFAKKRNIILDIDGDTVGFYSTNEDDMEPAVVYFLNERGMSYKANVYLSDATKEELPAWIPTEKYLRAVIDFLATTGEIK